MIQVEGFTVVMKLGKSLPRVASRVTLVILARFLVDFRVVVEVRSSGPVPLEQKTESRVGRDVGNAEQSFGEMQGTAGSAAQSSGRKEVVTAMPTRS